MRWPCSRRLDGGPGPIWPETYTSTPAHEETVTLKLDAPSTHFLRTKPCVVCGKTNQIEVDREGFQAWVGGTLIQDAFPTLTPDERELIQSGIHPACWEKLFGGDDD